MEAIKPTLQELIFCMREPGCIRNVCILAHVDHGKTTISDLLLATNQLVSKRLAGSLRYLDDRPDEQQRGITMKTSAVSLLNLLIDDDNGSTTKILLNIIDTPGHIDFSSEVGVALRVCDGAIIVVDIVEGVCVQTREAISRAFEEKTKMILILNKFDRLVLEIKKDVGEMFQYIRKVIEDCNAIIAELYQYEYTDNDKDIEDTGLLFSPETGNVIFASSIDGWGFTTKQIARLFVDLVNNETVDSLNKKMWDFDCYVDSKKDVKTGAIEKKKTNLFVQFCMKTVAQIYEAVVNRVDRDRMRVILERLKIKNITKDMMHSDLKVQLKAILQGWMPLSTTLLLQCLRIIPAPSQMQRSKVENLLNVNRFCENPDLNKNIEEVIPYFMNCTAEDDAPTIVYVSKMFFVSRYNLSQNKPMVLIPKSRDTLTLPVEDTYKRVEEERLRRAAEADTSEEKKYVSRDMVAIALARVFTGTIHVNQTVYVMQNSYVPDYRKINKNELDFIDDCNFVSTVVIKDLYMLFGRDLVRMDFIPAGNFCGIGGLENDVVRTATLSSTLFLVPITERLVTNPVVRHAIEPVKPTQLPILHNGLKLLMQSDPCVEIVMQKTGELVILTAGDVHLQKCIEDLRSKFAKIDFSVSKPMVSLRETVVTDYTDAKDINLETDHFSLTLKCAALPERISQVVKSNYELLRTVEDLHHKSFVDIAKECKDVAENSKAAKEKVFKSETLKKGIIHVKELLRVAAEPADISKDLFEKIWSVGCRNDCINLLVNNTGDYPHNIFLELNSADRRALFDHCMIKAFDTFCEAGPLCEEPLTDCMFVIIQFTLKGEVKPVEITPQVTSALEASIRDTFRTAFEQQEQRLVEPMFVTDIQVNTSILGKVYTVISKRHGKILNSVGMDDLEKTFMVKALIPVVESDGFTNEIRKTTSGQANPSLKFSHNEVIDGDPFCDTVEEDIQEASNVNVDSGIRANKLRKEVRRRKGLPVDDEVVVHAEKQRTLNKKK